MDNQTGDKISLRKATTDEIEYLKAKATRRDKVNRKRIIPIMAFVLLADLAMAIYKQELSYRILFICVFVLGIVGLCIYLFVISKSFSRQIAKGEFSVQRGTIVDKRSAENSDNEIYPKVFFDSDDGVRSLIAVEKIDYSNFTEGPCIIIKWDYYGESDVYEVVMLDSNNIE